MLADGPIRRRLDIEDSEKAELAPEGDELLRVMVESATEYAILSMDPQGIVTSWNTGGERLLGYCESEIIGRSADIFFTPEDRAKGIPEQERRQARSDGRCEDERWQMRKDGSLFWASGLAMPLSDANLGFVKIFRDRTDAHEAEARLRESEERFRLLATSIPQLVFLTRNDGYRTWGSPQWIEFTGLSLGDSVGFGWLDAVHADDLAQTRSAWVEAQRTGEYYTEHRLRRAADGEYRWHQTRARPIEDGSSSTNWVGTMTDIHDLRSLKDRQQVFMAELQHRTRNLLAVVQAIATQTRRSGGSLEAFGKEFDSRLRALGRVQSLLARMDHHDIDLRELVAAELEAHGDGALEGKAQVNGPSVALPAMSAQALGLAIHELATNAVKYGALAQQGGRLDVLWREEAESSGRTVVLRWVETGVDLAKSGVSARKGYGSELIERALPYQLGAKTKLEFGPDGLRCTIAVPLKNRSDEATHE